jgi:histone-lysine N-methyltransferase ASH1L
MSPPLTHVEPIRASSSDSIDSALTVDEISNAQSSSSTPPTSIGDDASVSSTSLKLDNMQATPLDDSGERSRRVRTSVGTYNVKVLSGTAIHAPKKFAKDRDTGNETRRRTISGDTLVETPASAEPPTDNLRRDAGTLIRDGLAALDLEWSIINSPGSDEKTGLAKSPHQSPSKTAPKGPRRIAKERETMRERATRSTSEKVENLTRKLTASAVLGKRKLEDGLAKAKRDLRNLADTKEFAKIDTEPVVYEVWSKGKLVVHEPPRKKRKLEEEAAQKEKEKEKAKAVEAELAPKPQPPGKRQKVWLHKGLYAGQEPEKFDWFSNYTAREKEQMAIEPPKPNKYLPLPMWHGQRLLHVGRTFKLPFDVCSPLPPGQPKPDEWRKTSSSKLHFEISIYLANIPPRSFRG